LALTGVGVVAVLALAREKPALVAENGPTLAAKLGTESVDQDPAPVISLHRPPHATPPVMVDQSRSPTVPPTPTTAKTASEAPPATTAGAPKRFPTTAEIQAAMRATPITMFSTSWCPTCARARVFLQTNDLRYTERDIDHDEMALQELRRRSGDTKIPTFEIDGKMLTPGLDQTALVNALVAGVERRLGVTGIRVQFR
jgi:glutaredoxin